MLRPERPAHRTALAAYDYNAYMDLPLITPKLPAELSEAVTLESARAIGAVIGE